MTELEKQKTKLNIKKAETAKLELEYKILERMEDIQRMREHIQLQDQRIDELTKSLKE